MGKSTVNKTLPLRGISKVYPVDNMNITAAILAGGKGTRLIAHKGLLEIDGRAIIERQLSKLKSIFNDIAIITNSPEFYRNLKVRLIPDIILDKGPLGGIYSALKYSKTQHSFIIASDMPYLNSSLLKYMLKNIGDYDAIVPEFNGCFEPLYAFYSKNCTAIIENQIKKNNLKVSDFLRQVKIKKIEQKEISEFDPLGLSFVNINTEEDYRKIKREVASIKLPIS